ncbi:hypothetical protein SAMN04488597_104162 [Halanaerobium congolense]|jgi:hypothetical protein|uniref:Uncharacterized protein n=1 Tax=Halanaerobium congolense TaxID=54121 RepID=A0A1G6KLU1_9FIRM|nr:MAG: hypothetical protein CI949_3497 [Halanaerobium sp.]PXV62887.1 hypothetical protein C8C78_1285 [Halanaerobium congolense]SDC31798.1 hypothetical protein SAMN04488597_104162 [Halanaerobium congolense]
MFNSMYKFMKEAKLESKDNQAKLNAFKNLGNY